MTRPGLPLWTSALVLAVLSACGSGVSTGDCEGDVTPIHDLQGAGKSSPLAGERVSVRGVVVGDFSGPERLGGFFLQEERADDDPRTSEGLFVFTRQAPELAPGDRVQVSGRVKEHQGLTELGDVDHVTVCERGLPVPPVALGLDERDLEPYEGMLVTVDAELTVADNHQLAELGRLLLAPGGRLFQPTNGAVPRTDGAGRRIAGRRLLIDDGSRTKFPVPPPFLDAAGTRRTGDTVRGLTGVITEAGDDAGYLLLPTVPPAFVSANPRGGVPEVAGNVRVVSFNLLNLFTTFEQRGASNADELERQLAKHEATLAALAADVVGVVELENHDAAARRLVDALNTVADEAKGPWAHVETPPGALGDDDIRVGILYRPRVARPVGPPRVDPDPVFRRPPLAQTFDVRGERFTVVVNHFKSKSCREADPDDRDAVQGCWNRLRTRQAERLAAFVTELQTASGDDDVLVIGDLNAYGAEDPIHALTEAGLVDQIALHVPPEERYSYVYNGESGYLDHALTTPSLSPKVAGAAFWHVNSDEPTFHDYNTENGAAELFARDPYRSSDHDPVLIGLRF